MRTPKRLNLEEYTSGILAGNRNVLSKAITLIESQLPYDREISLKLLTDIMPYTGKSFRIGITGPPGAGKSTLLESFGSLITKSDGKVAILAIDPSSTISGGSILGDKTRMESLAANKNAFIRPTPSGGTLGGIAQKTKETILLCEAAGFDHIIVETVGVGQSETEVSNMTDILLLLLLTGAGDELQSFKKGINEIADIFVITKADGSNLKTAQKLKSDLESVMNALHSEKLVTTCSAVTNTGISELYSKTIAFLKKSKESEKFENKRKSQNILWMKQMTENLILESFYQHPGISNKLKEYQQMVLEGKVPAPKAAIDLIDIYKHKITK